MAKTTFTLEEILQEYGPDGKDSSSKQVEHQPLPSGKLETEKMLSAAAPTPIGRHRLHLGAERQSRLYSQNRSAVRLQKNRTIGQRCSLLF